MSTSIAKFLSTASIKSKLNAALELTHAFLIDPRKEARYKAEGLEPDPDALDQYEIFDTYAPVQLSTDFRFLEYASRSNVSIASVTATGQEIPQTSGGGELVKMEGGMIKITLGIGYDEEKRIQMYEFSQMPNMSQTFVDDLFKGIINLQTRVMRTMNVLTCQVWSQGKIRFTDPRTNVGIRADYNVYPELFPRPLTGNDAWNRYSTANGIRNLIDHWNVFYRISGSHNPANVTTVMSWDLAQHLLQQSSTADYARSLGLLATPGAAMYSPTFVDFDTLNKCAERLRFPKIRIWDAMYSAEVAPGQFLYFRYLPSNRYMFLVKGGKRVWGPTIEAIDDGKGNKAGIFVKPDEILKTSPPQSRSYAVGRGIPFFEETRKLGGRQVMDEAA
jgi:hypothetical protein